MDFLRRYVTMVETWIHHYTLETKGSSAEWTADGESRAKRPNTQQWAGKVIDYLEKVIVYYVPRRIMRDIT